MFRCESEPQLWRWAARKHIANVAYGVSKAATDKMTVDMATEPRFAHEGAVYGSRHAAFSIPLRVTNGLPLGAYN